MACDSASGKCIGYGDGEIKENSGVVPRLTMLKKQAQAPSAKDNQSPEPTGVSGQ